MGKAATVERLKIPLSQLSPDPSNPRTISEAAFDGLTESVDEYGDLSGIVFNKRTGELVTGHQRLEVLKGAGAAEIEVDALGRWFIVHPETGETFHVRVVDWAPERQRIANLVANNPAIAGEFTPAALEQLRALEDEAAFTALRLDAMQEQIAADLAELEADMSEPEPGATDPDEVPEPPVEPITKPGDLWVLGDHKLLCGDATKLADVERLMGGEHAALCVTDPPYGVSVAGGTRDPRDEKNYRSGGKIDNDGLTGEALREFLDAAFTHVLAVLVPGAAWYVWFAGSETRAFLDATDRLGGMRHMLIWIKPNFVFGRSDYHYRHEPCFYGWTPGAGHRWLGSRDQSSVFEAGRDQGPEGIERKQHPTVKPVALFEVPMRNHTERGDICYEPFSGSGSQIIAGERLGRRVFAMELSPRYVDVAVARWEAFTGKKAERQPASVHGDDDVNF